MRSQKLGRSDLEVSAIGLGCMSISEFYGKPQEKRGERTLQHALDIGVTFWDTADAYGRGHNEEVVGRAARGRRDDVVIATKFGFVRDAGGQFIGVSGRPDYVRQACDASLERLGVDTIDLYYQHRVDPEVQIEETVGAMVDLVEQGKVRHLGLSEAGAATVRRAAAVHPIAALQTEYSLWSRDIETDILATCRELGIGLVAYSPLGRGFLTGKLRHPSELSGDDFRLRTPRFAGENFTRNLALVDRLDEMARANDCTTAQLALAWVIEQGSDIVPIPGTTSPERLAENTAAIDVALSASDLAALDELMAPGHVAGDRYSPDGMAMVNV